MVAGSGLAAAAQVVRNVTSLLTVPLTVKYFGQEAYGLWMVTLSTLSVLSIVDAGLAPAAKNRMAQAFGRRDLVQFNRYASGTLLIGGVAASLGAIAVPLIATIDWGSLLALSDHQARAGARGLIVSASAAGFVSFSLGGVEAIYAARLRMPAVSAASIAASLSSFGLLSLCVAGKAPLWCFPLAAVGPTILSRTVLLGLLWTGDRAQVISSFRTIPLLIQELLPSSIAFIGIQAGNVAIGALPNLLLAGCAGVGSVTAFSVAQRMASVPLMILAAVLPVYWPAFTIAWARHEFMDVARRLETAMVLTAAALAASGGILYLFGDAIAFAWTRGAVHVPASTIALLCAWVLIQGLGYWLGTFLNAIGDLAIQVICAAAHAAILFILGSWVAPAKGVSGIALAMLVAVVIAMALPLGVRVRGHLRAPTNAGVCR